MTNFTSIAKGPFTPATPAPTLTSKIGFGPATINMFSWTGCDGKMLYGCHTDFTDSSAPGGFVTTASSVTNTFTAMDGTATGDKLVENNANSAHSIAQNSLVGTVSTIAYTPIPFRLMVIAAAAERTRIVVQLQELHDSTNAVVSVGYDLAGGNTGYDTVNGTKITLIGESMVDLGTQAGIHWWACLLDWSFNTANTGTTPTSVQLLPTIFLDNGSGTAARSTSYTGNGTSGAYIWMVHMLPKGIWKGFSQSFHDDFQNISTVDVTNSRANGFNWYFYSRGTGSTPAWPNGNPSNFWNNTLNTMTLTQPSQSILEVTDPVSHNSFAAASTVAYTSGSGAGSFTGTATFQPPYIMDASLTYSASYDLNTAGEGSILNSFWSVAVETLANFNLDANNNYVEFDYEDNPNSNWIYFESLAPNTDNTGGCAVWSGLSLTGTKNGIFAPIGVNDYQRVTSYWLSSGAGGSGISDWGCMDTFVNGKFPQAASNAHGGAYQISTATAYGAGTSTFAGLNNPSAGITAVEALHYMIFLSAQNNTVGTPANPMFCDWVSVYQ